MLEATGSAVLRSEILDLIESLYRGQQPLRDLTGLHLRSLFAVAY